MAWIGARNRLLASLPSADRQRIEPSLEPFQPALKEVLSSVDEPIENVVFPLGGVISIVAADDDGTVVEIATVGREGLLGLPVWLGGTSMRATAFAQIPGDALRMRSEDFRAAVDSMPRLSGIVQLYTQALFTQLSQSVVCNRIHSIEERASRWLLSTSDRIDASEFALTQEFLGQMLGVRRASVNLVARELSQAGLIEYTRGRVNILDRDGLEDTSCRCYRIIADEFDRLLGSRG